MADAPASDDMSVIARLWRLERRVEALEAGGVPVERRLALPAPAAQEGARNGADG